MFDHGFPSDWSTIKKLIWLKGAGIIGGASAVWKTVTGTLIHITDALASPMQKCEVTLEPIQSGSGDPSPDNPRPITGWTGTAVNVTGVNLYDKSTVLQGYRLDGNGEPYSAASYSLSGWISVKAETTYTRNIDITASQAVCFYKADKTFIQRLPSQSGTFTTTADTAYIRTSTLNTDVDTCQIELGSSATPYSPYSGTAYSVTFPAIGNNILDMSDGNIEVGKYIDNSGAEKTNGSNFYNSAYFPVKASTAYTISTSTAIKYCSFMEYDENKTFIKRTLYGGSTSFSSQTHTMGDTTAYILFGANPTGTTVSLPDIQQISWMLNEGSTDLPYEPYTSTVYGGKFNFVDGNGDSNLAKVDLGTLTWSYSSANQYFTTAKSAIGMKTGADETMICSHYKTVTASGTHTSGSCWNASTSVHIMDTNYTDATTFKNAMSGVQLVFELADSVDFTLTPQQILTLAGENNVWGDGTIELTYKAQA